MDGIRIEHQKDKTGRVFSKEGKENEYNCVMMLRFGGQEEEVSFGLIQLVEEFIESTGIGEVNLRG